VVAVSARSASDLPAAAEVLTVDLRVLPGVRAGTLPWAGPDVATGWHRHPYHQIEYALRGVAEVETPTGHYLLPPQQAIWIPAGLPHATTLHNVSSIAVFFEPAMLVGPADYARVLPAAALVREMIVYGQRWLISRTDTSAAADAFFDALAHVVGDWLDQEVPLCLPTTADPTLAAVIEYTNDHLATVREAEVCRAVGLSERSLRRRFAGLGLTWSAYVLQSRLLRAMSILASDEQNIAYVANAVGFASPSAFTRAFRALTGESPAAYRRRLRTSASRPSSSAGERGTELIEPLGHDAPVHPAARLLAGDQPGVGEHLGVVAHGGLALSDRLDHVARATRAGRGDHGEQAQADRVGQRGEGFGQLGGAVVGDRPDEHRAAVRHGQPSRGSSGHGSPPVRY
jgi:AraC-like DNA-binding protein